MGKVNATYGFTVTGKIKARDITSAQKKVAEIQKALERKKLVINHTKIKGEVGE